MKSVGETMAIGRTFKEALQKAVRSLEIGRFSLLYPLPADITDNKELLEESKLVYEGNQPVIDRLEISNIRKVEVLDSFIDMAIEDAIKSKELIEKTKLNIESLIELK